MITTVDIMIAKGEIIITSIRSEVMAGPQSMLFAYIVTWTCCRGISSLENENNAKRKFCTREFISTFHNIYA
jgi:hypothetical protein